MCLENETFGRPAAATDRHMGWLIFEDSILRVSAGRPINSAGPIMAEIVKST
jgi:hypothetical protein